MTEAANLTRGRLARASGVNPETIRFYETKGLLPQPRRSPSGYRLYGPDQIQRLNFIRRSQELGFALGEIKELLSLRARPRGSNSRVKRLAEKKIGSILAKITDLQRMQKVLAKITKACDGCGSAEDCPILQALEGLPATKAPRKKKTHES